MSTETRPDVHLEVSSGFFRIPTEKVIYNITVLDAPEGVVAPRPSTVAPVESTLSAPVVPVGEQVEKPPQDTYYKDVAMYYSIELNRIVNRLGAGLDALPQAAEEMAVDTTTVAGHVTTAKHLVSELAAIPSSSSKQDAGGGNDGSAMIVLTAGMKDMQEQIGRLREMLGTSEEDVPKTPPEKASGEEVGEKTRYLFELDTVFQTIYELCTNETVKEHSQNARARAAEIFDTGVFLDGISEKVPSYTEDDGFLSVPLADVLNGLAACCSDTKVCNLLKNMNKQQADIFLDQFLPLEVPPVEQVGGGTSQETPEETVATDGGVQNDRLPEAIAVIDALEAQVAELLQGVETGGSVESSQPPETSDTTESLTALQDELAALEGAVENWTDASGSGETSAAGEVALREAMSVLRQCAQSFSGSLAEKEEEPALSFTLVQSAEAGGAPPASIQEETSPSHPPLQDMQEEFSSEEDQQGVPPVEFDNDEIDDVQERFDSMVAEQGEHEEIADASDASDAFEDALEFDSEEQDDDIDDSDDFGEASQDDIDKLLEEMGG